MAACRLPGNEPEGSEGVRLPASVPIAIEVETPLAFVRVSAAAPSGLRSGMNARPTPSESRRDCHGSGQAAVDEIGRIGLVALMDATDDRDPARPIAQLHARG